METPGDMEPSEPQTLDELRLHLGAHFLFHTWWSADPVQDGVVFHCGDCGTASEVYPSAEEGEQALELAGEAVRQRWRDYLTDWATRHRDLAPEGSSFFMLVGCTGEPEHAIEPRPWTWPRAGAVDTDRGQHGLAHLVLQQLSLVGVVKGPLTDLAQRFGLRIEHSFGDSHDCELAYFETELDAYSLVRWDPTENVEVYAYVPPPDGHPDPGLHGREEFARFRLLAEVADTEVVFPRVSPRSPGA